MNLLNQKCKPCKENDCMLSAAEISDLHKQVPDWELAEDTKGIFRLYKFKDFKQSLDFVNRVGEIAEQLGHHPDIKIEDYNKVEIKLSTRSIRALSINDFIVAANIDK